LIGEKHCVSFQSKISKMTSKTDDENSYEICQITKISEYKSICHVPFETKARESGRVPPSILFQRVILLFVPFVIVWLM
jgi:hypothetical protein